VPPTSCSGSPRRSGALRSASASPGSTRSLDECGRPVARDEMIAYRARRRGVGTPGPRLDLVTPDGSRPCPRGRLVL
jgi:hypothetical protein